ncbi:MAG: DegT/DnrJ/EryC1/StrS family aminotransferase [Bacteroidales bacterium]|nr:DegT/DnrJ/EryC1/StrS family aminotransferase [Bacteroidales bacterium]
MPANINIPFYGIDRFYNQHAQTINTIFSRVLSSGKVLMGKEVDTFEINLAHFVSRKYALSVGSCTDALFFALKAAGVEAGDEVIVPAFSYIASVTPILRAGAVPVFADIHSSDLSMSFDDFKRKISPKTKALIFVHMYGAFSPLMEIAKYARNHNIILIEDAAHSLGAISEDNVKAGSVGQMACFSFDPTKVIGAFGTGGAIVTDDEDFFNTIRKLRFHGKDSFTGEFDIPGYNSRISTLQAALLDFQLGMIDTLITQRNKIASKYDASFENLNDIEIVSKPQGCTYHKYVIKTDKRDELENHLKAKGIATMRHYDKALFENKLFKNHPFKAESISVVHDIKKKVLSLPIFPEMTTDEVLYVAEGVKSFFKKS